jgi:hypothetical protein
MAMYCFEGMYHTMNNLTTLPCTELGFLPAYAGKVQYYRVLELKMSRSVFTIVGWDIGRVLTP